MHHIAILLPLIVSIGATILTIFCHALVAMTVVHFIIFERQSGRAGTGFWTDTAIIATVVMMALTAHLVEIAIWAELFVMLGEFQDFAIAFYHSAVNYTTLGYGDIVMSSQWKLMAPIEAADGALMFGVSAAQVFAIIQRLVRTRFRELAA